MTHSFLFSGLLALFWQSCDLNRRIHVEPSPPDRNRSPNYVASAIRARSYHNNFVSIFIYLLFLIVVWLLVFLYDRLQVTRILVMNRVLEQTFAVKPIYMLNKVFLFDFLPTILALEQSMGTVLDMSR